ncbi:unnamed protein product, partial [Citrullus colocynthis]
LLPFQNLLSSIFSSLICDSKFHCTFFFFNQTPQANTGNQQFRRRKPVPISVHRQPPVPDCFRFQGY